MKSVELRLRGIADEQFHQRVMDTVDHTLQTLSASFNLFNDREAFNRTFETAVEARDLAQCDFDSVIRLMFIHDLHKLVENAGHAEKGADFLSAAVVGLVRHHDKFGVIHTGEAPFLSLKPITDWISEMPPEERDVALSLLPVVTIIDTASLGYLNQPRVESYRQIKQVIQDAVSGNRSLEQMTLDDTVDRLRRLIGCNNRTFAERPLIEKALSAFPHKDAFTHAVARVRFDAGVYVLEPYLRFTVTPSICRMKQTEALHLCKAHIPALNSFILCLHRLAEANPSRDGNVSLVNLNHVSIKGDKNIEAFESWAKEQSSK